MERFVVRRDGERVVITLGGEIVMDMIQEYKVQMEHLLSADGCREVVADLADVTFMDSSAIGFLIGMRRRAESSGRKFRLQNPSHQIKKLLDMLRLSDFFAMGQNREGGRDRSA
jgi:anti-anti-sigma factor